MLLLTLQFTCGSNKSSMGRQSLGLIMQMSLIQICAASFLITRSTEDGTTSPVYNIFFGDEKYPLSLKIFADPADLVLVEFEDGSTDEELPTSIIAKHVLVYLQGQIVAASKSGNTDRLQHLLDMQLLWDYSRQSYLYQEVDMKLTNRRKRFRGVPKVATPKFPLSTPVPHSTTSSTATTSSTTPASTTTTPTSLLTLPPSSPQTATVIAYIANPKNALYRRCTTILLYIDIVLLCILCTILYVGRFRPSVPITLTWSYFKKYSPLPLSPASEV